MNKENVQKWIDNLLSGRFIQTQGDLKNSDGYCCLGVLCETYIENGNHLNIRKNNTNYSYDDSSSHLPDKVINWIDEKIKDNGEYFVDGKWHCLIDDNDDGKSFKEIAQIIKEHYLGEI